MLRGRGKPLQAQLSARYRADGNGHALDVVEVVEVLPGRSCHLSDMFDAIGGKGIEQTVGALPDLDAPMLSITVEQVEAEQSLDLTRCLSFGDAAKGVSLAMGGCVNAELRVQDERMNTAYRSAMARLDAVGRAQLRSEQRAWIRQRDSGCAENRTGGTIDMVDIPSCLLDETIRRRLVLEATAR